MTRGCKLFKHERVLRRSDSPGEDGDVAARLRVAKCAVTAYRFGGERVVKVRY